uniref:BHLH domain-containing protein n=1 Tax=Latimeria chalumnae TaxID=7897 RepID=H3ASI6_LATCH
KPSRDHHDNHTSLKMIKPLVEKRRRDRINESLEQLRVLLLENTQDERLHNPKMEKAEILELTVKYLKNITPLNLQGPQTSEEVTMDYEAGFRKCLMRLMKFMTEVNPSAKTQLRGHFQQYLSKPVCKKSTEQRRPSAYGSQCPLSEYYNQCQGGSTLQAEERVLRQATGLQFPRQHIAPLQGVWRPWP